MSEKKQISVAPSVTPGDHNYYLVPADSLNAISEQMKTQTQLVQEGYGRAIQNIIPVRVILADAPDGGEPAGGDGDADAVGEPTRLAAAK